MDAELSRVTAITETAYSTLSRIAEQVRDPSRVVPGPLFGDDASWLTDLVELVRSGCVELTTPGAVTVTRRGMELVTARRITSGTKAA